MSPTFPTHMAPLRYNPIIDADSYKVPHWMLYRDGLKNVYSFLESRGGENDEIMTAGVQPLMYHLGEPVEDWMIEEAGEFFTKHFGFPSYFNKKLWDEIVNKHDRMLPLKIRALPEGLMVPKRTPMLTVENTGSAVTAALTSYKETMLLRNLWPACSIATRIFRMKRKIKPFFDETSDNGVSPFALLDFCSRGVFGDDHSKLAGAVFCFMFQGSDNMPGIRHANYYYFHDMAAYSVLASEHSIASGFGQDNDDDYIDHMLNRAPQGAIVSIVGDTWNIFEFTKKLVREDRRNLIANKDLKVVVRPDSGERQEVIPHVLATLANAAGTTTNSKGFDVLNANLKVLWADGMNEKTVIEPFALAKSLNIAADSIMTGAGGGIAAADMDRDTDRWAFKASEYTMEDGTRIPVFKQPITDPGKNSKRGRFAVVPCSSPYPPHTKYVTVNRTNDEEIKDDLLQTRFLDGAVADPVSLDQIRKLIESQL